jgi:hypothetical protein
MIRYGAQMPNVPDERTPTWPMCGICNEPVRLETSKTDETGRAVHEECYILKVKLHRPTTLPD